MGETNGDEKMKIYTDWYDGKFFCSVITEELEELKKSGLGEDCMYRLVENDIKNYRSTEGN